MTEKTAVVEEKGAIPAAQVPAAAGAAPAAAKLKTLLNIVRGRMPIAVVAQVRFGNKKNEGSADLAKAYGTTVGKIDDIKKNRNFAYVTADYKPTQEQKDEGIAYLRKHPDFASGAVDPMITELENTKVATPEEAAAFATKRSAAKGQPATKADGTAIPAGGGNNVGKQAKAAAKAAAPPVIPPAASAADLLK